MVYSLTIPTKFENHFELELKQKRYSQNNHIRKMNGMMT